LGKDIETVRLLILDTSVIHDLQFKYSNAMVDKIPEFTNEGLLPRGDYEATFDELRESVLVVGPEDKRSYPNWDVGWRRWLVDQLEILTLQLWQVGITEVFADGSYA